nr:hypothetical protein [Oribacterium sp. NK2B42]
MGNDLGLDIPEIINAKLADNNRKYPAEKAYGKADKYTAYVTDGGNHRCLSPTWSSQRCSIVLTYTRFFLWNKFYF